MLARDLKRIKASNFDLLVIGSGIFGACAAWEATLRGLRVAIVDVRDFGAATSANSFKMVHGGIRYMQHLDLLRVRSSCHERSAFLRIAPHLVQPLPIVMPTYGYGTKGKAFLAAGMWSYDAVTIDRNFGIVDQTRRIPMSRCLSREKVLSQFPELSTTSLTGGAVFYDAQMYNPTRLVLAFIQSAAAKGAVPLNYTAAREIRIENGRVRGCFIEDTLTGEKQEIACSAILNAAGPWAEGVLSRNGIPSSANAPPAYSRDSCFVVKRRFDSDYALAIPGSSADSDAILSRDARHLFLAPWRNYTLVGVWHKVWQESPDAIGFDREDLLCHLDEINSAYPTLNLCEDDVLMWNAGLLPFGDQRPGDQGLSFGKRSSLIDHQQEHGIKGLVTLIGVRYTMGRGDGAQAINMLFGNSRKDQKSRTDSIPVYGGDIGSFDELVTTIHKKTDGELSPRSAKCLAHNYGSKYPTILKLAKSVGCGLQSVPGTTTLRAEVYNAVRNEMAMNLADVVFRRTDVATGGHPGMEAIEVCAEIVADELKWDRNRRTAEIEDVLSKFPGSASRHADVAKGPIFSKEVQ
jgi:glycerol-3-phosphate dehydrogenase